MSSDESSKNLSYKWKGSKSNWKSYFYDPLKAGSIDGTDTEPHDHGIVRALQREYYPDRRIKGKPECTIFIANLDKNTTENHIKVNFSKYGHIVSCRVVRDVVTGHSRGYAFVEYDSKSSAVSAYVNGNKQHINGSSVLVDYECGRHLRGWKPRRIGGGFGGKKESGQLRFGGRSRPFKKPLTTEMLRDSLRKRKKEHEGSESFSLQRDSE